MGLFNMGKKNADNHYYTKEDLEQARSEAAAEQRKLLGDIKRREKILAILGPINHSKLTDHAYLVGMEQDGSMVNYTNIRMDDLRLLCSELEKFL